MSRQCKVIMVVGILYIIPYIYIYTYIERERERERQRERERERQRDSVDVSIKNDRTIPVYIPFTALESLGRSERLLEPAQCHSSA